MLWKVRGDADSREAKKFSHSQLLQSYELVSVTLWMYVQRKKERKCCYCGPLDSCLCHRFPAILAYYLASRPHVVN